MTDIQAWRKQALHAVLLILAIGATPVIVLVGVEAIQHPERAAAAPAFLAFYILLLVLALVRRLPHWVKIAGFLGIGYAVAVTALARGGLIGDGRLFLLILPLLALVLADLRTGAIAGAVSLLIHIAFAFFAQTGLLAQWVVVTENPMALPDWLSATAVFLMLLAGLIVLLGLFNRTLLRSMEETRRSARQVAEAYQQLEEQAVGQRRYVRWLEVAAQTALEAGAEMDPDVLLSRAARGLYERLALTGVSVYTVGPDGDLNIQAQAGNPVREVSLIARAALQTRAPHAGRVEREYELACPMRLGERILGVIAARALSELPTDGVEAQVLALIADQLALALEKARLFAQTQANLREMEALYRRYTTQAWEQFAQEAPTTAQLWAGAEEVPPGIWQNLSEQARSSGAPVMGEENGRYLLAVPVKLRGLPIGVLGLHREREAGAWRAEEIAMAEAVAERLALAVENARLLEESQRRAAREQLVSSIAARMRETMDMDRVLQIAVQEISRALGLAEAEVRMKSNIPGE